MASEVKSVPSYETCVLRAENAEGSVEDEESEIGSISCRNEKREARREMWKNKDKSKKAGVKTGRNREIDR